MTPGRSLYNPTITLYKAIQKGKRTRFLEYGFQPADFPYNPPYFDGCFYFAGPDDRSIAEEFNQNYQGGILEVTMDQVTYERYFKSLEYCYDVGDDCERIEVVVPQELLPMLNQFPRVLKPQ
ncbi:MAG: hypothetical protein WBB01_08880 [Phormidesmis sp.]